MSGPIFDIALLGRPRLRTMSGPIHLSPGSSILCAYVALAPDGGCSREKAASQLFVDTPLPSARRRLSTALWRLRTEVRAAAGVDLVEATEDAQIQLHPAIKTTLDTEAFKALAAPALSASPQELTPVGAASLERAVALYHGQLVEPCLDEWVIAERTRIENLYLTALDHLVVYFGGHRDHQKVRYFGEIALGLEPLREDLQRHLMEAYAESGRHDLVEHTFERFRSRLLAELGADPMPETVALYSHLRRGEYEVPASLAALMTELQRARRDVARLSAVVERSIEHLIELRRLPL